MRIGSLSLVFTVDMDWLPSDQKPSATMVLEVVRRFSSAQEHETPGVGLGVEHRVAEDRVTGHALTLNGALVHAAFFTGSPAQGSPWQEQAGWLMWSYG